MALLYGCAQHLTAQNGCLRPGQMEEADALGDKVAIMHQGRLRAVGTSLFLKAKFGKGHTISILFFGSMGECRVLDGA